VEALYRGLPQRGRVLGSRRAPYTLVEFADLQCPFCGAFDRGVLPQILARYVRTGRLRIELRLIAFIGPDSATAASAAAAAELQDRLWQFADLVYRNQRRENSGYVTPRFLGAIARAVPGLDQRRFARASGSPPLLRILRSDAAAAGTAGVTSTPTFRLGATGRRLGGPISRQDLLARLAGSVG
jgi:protein-disulfide isomerase